MDANDAPTTAENGDTVIVPETHVIDAGGDVILVVGEDKKRLRVSSDCLKRGSRVFKVMFSGRFAEGYGGSASNPKEIEFPDDESEGMSMICSIVHLRNDQLPLELGPKSLVAFLHLSDKYDTMTSCEIFSRLWLKGCYWYSQIEDAANIIAAAYVLRSESSFQRVMRPVIWRTVWSAEELHEHLEYDSVPFSVLLTIEQRRQTARKHFSAGLDKCKKSKCLYEPSRRCQRCAHIEAQISSAIRAIDLSQPSESSVPLNDAYDILKPTDYSRMSPSSHPDTCDLSQQFEQDNLQLRSEVFDICWRNCLKDFL